MNIENVKKHVVTSLVGLAVLGYTVRHMFTVPAFEWTHVIIGMGLGFSLLLSPDDVIKKLKTYLKTKNP